MLNRDLTSGGNPRRRTNPAAGQESKGSTDDLDAWAARLHAFEVAEQDQVFGHRGDLAGRGQVMAPLFVPAEADGRAVPGTVPPPAG